MCGIGLLYLYMQFRQGKFLDIFKRGPGSVTINFAKKVLMNGNNFCCSWGIGGRDLVISAVYKFFTEYINVSNK